MSAPGACMILAAGFGTRMGELTKAMPKPLIEVSGRPLIDHSLTVARAAGVARIVVNGHYLAGQMRGHLEGMPDVAFSDEQPEIMDSAGGIRQALPLLNAAEFATLNSDAVWTGENAISQLAAVWNPRKMDVLTLLVPQSQAVGRKQAGDFGLDGAGRISWDKSAHVYTGAQILKADLFEGYPPGPFSLHEIWNAAMAQGRMFGVMHRGHWADVGHPAGIGLAEAMIEEFGDV